MEWQPIETAPKDESEVDIFSESKGRLKNYRRVDLGRGDTYYEGVEYGYTCIRDATHWMPLPKAPE